MECHNEDILLTEIQPPPEPFLARHAAEGAVQIRSVPDTARKKR